MTQAIVGRNPREMIWLTGPSGAGKSHVIELLRRRIDRSERPITLDLDFVGYRKADEDWTDWHINKNIFALLADNSRAAGQSVVAVGSDSSPDDLKKSATSAGFECVILLPSLIELTARRRQRGDSHQKIADSEESLRNWTNIAQRWDCPVVQTAEGLIAQWRL